MTLNDDLLKRIDALIEAIHIQAEAINNLVAITAEMLDTIVEDEAEDTPLTLLDGSCH